MTREGAGAEEMARQLWAWAWARVSNLRLAQEPPVVMSDAPSDHPAIYHFCEALDAASAVATAKERVRCMMAIRAACSSCEGTGYADGNPDEGIECEYCGRPRDAILGRGDEQDGAPQDEKE